MQMLLEKALAVIFHVFAAFGHICAPQPAPLSDTKLRVKAVALTDLLHGALSCSTSRVTRRCAGRAVAHQA